MSNPYKNIDDVCFWSRAMSNPAPGHIDPVTTSELIHPHHKVATMGSCFAQHLARHIQAAGLTYFVPEQPPPELNADQAKLRNFGVFSARYGNVYTVRQAVQLFDRAFGQFQPIDDVWKAGQKFVDAFRPQIEPEQFSSEVDVRAAATNHLEHVRAVFVESDWLVFTLGLTEAWRSRVDGAVYPIVPGVAGGHFDPAKYEFVNFSADEVKHDLVQFIEKVRSVNPRLRILLTVSPVPLIATYERRHVWVSTTVSKAILRVSADEAERKFQNVTYFPSYEVITSPTAAGKYYADNLRDVTAIGVKHVMRLFTAHFVENAAPLGFTLAANPALSSVVDPGVVCDEEIIEKSMRISGF